MQISSLTFNKDDVYSIYLDADRSHPVYVVDIGFHQTPPEHTYGPAIREYYLLHLIESGKGTIERNGVITPLQAGEAFLIRPGETTTYRADANEPWTYYWISFNGTFAKTLVEKTTNLLCMPYQKSGLIALKTAFLQAFQNENVDMVGILRLLLNVLDSIKTQETSIKKSETTDTIALAMRYMESNYHRDIDVGSLASQLGFSRAYFSTLFQKTTGETPYHYLTKLRISRAQGYLQSSALSVEEIAYSVGFSSLQRFSEMFKKECGYSPLQYRKSIHGH
ncbi:MAG: AraC family transcriptional regulator [Clostridia bacterium]|nr:AraC family transcriptional regulator [Clostridia bacterium]